MIAHTGYYEDTSYPEARFYFRYPVYESSFWIPDPKPTRGELARRWWEYVETYGQRIERAVARVIRSVSRVIHPVRIHHERQYPRIIKYRNNRCP